MRLARRSPALVALAWLLHQEGVTAPIIAPRTIEQLDEPQRAVKLALRPDTLERLDAILPGRSRPWSIMSGGSHRWPALATPVAGRSVFLAAAGQH